MFAASLAGSRSADPTCGMLLRKTQSSIPTLPYAISYSIAQVTLTLPGPIIVALISGRSFGAIIELWMGPLRTREPKLSSFRTCPGRTPDAYDRDKGPPVARTVRAVWNDAFSNARPSGAARRG